MTARWSRSAAILAGVVVVTAASPVAAGAGVGRFWNGNDMLEHCRHLTGGEPSSICAGYLMGVADLQEQYVRQFDWAPAFCLRAGVTTRQLRDVVVAYLEAHPANRDALASGLVTIALYQKFPCPE